MINPKDLAMIQGVTQNIKGKIEIDYNKNSLELFLETGDPKAQAAIPGMLSQLADQFATQLFSFMRIQGEIIEKNKRS